MGSIAGHAERSSRALRHEFHAPLFVYPKYCVHGHFLVDGHERHRAKPSSSGVSDEFSVRGVEV